MPQASISVGCREQLPAWASAGVLFFRLDSAHRYGSIRQECSQSTLPALPQSTDGATRIIHPPATLGPQTEFFRSDYRIRVAACAAINDGLVCSCEYSVHFF
ncbi:hypothetical protein CBM2633_P110009 [Cupriavidus taiwanensis]|uniref:Uncharacterized protein n=2 Tax=Cupriavidus TaxID=106589 RepID=A0A375D9Z4_9BURK|nr:hypothetical protein CBM2592_P140009 [Cupriavidus taiwanensis]SOZ40412.1 hypothetical protein CBM2605_P110009 [Cupriavidus neocaledonicus]SOY74338.1 hypothetical protein CBM2585_P110009 [Cupriavidus taiwanensis]SOY74347.1 hypothetical protein CBM2588_P130009 [Cupriavidus taiwanensis]SOY75287.1 hypothetical protein CBM2589_P110009 [Cupriavidus taiwanensis]